MPEARKHLFLAILDSVDLLDLSFGQAQGSYEMVGSSSSSSSPRAVPGLPAKPSHILVLDSTFNALSGLKSPFENHIAIT